MSQFDLNGQVATIRWTATEGFPELNYGLLPERVNGFFLQGVEKEPSTQRFKRCSMIEIDVQNETDQTQATLRFAAVPRIGDGVQLLSLDGAWKSHDVVDVWYQKASYGDVWTPYLHVRETAAEAKSEEASPEEEVARRSSANDSHREAQRLADEAFQAARNASAGLP